MQRLRRWKIQDDERYRGVHKLRGSDVLSDHKRDACSDLSRVCTQFQLGQRELSTRCLHVQRRFHWPKRRTVHRLRRWKIQDQQR